MESNNAVPIINNELKLKVNDDNGNNDNNGKEEKYQSVMEENIICPVTHAIMKDPTFITTCGHTFEKESLIHILNGIPSTHKCPICRKILIPET
jgi:hypothetical protein